MPITLSLSSVDLDEEDMQELTRQLCRDLTDEAGIAAALGAEPSEAGAKGDFEIIGQILIKALGAGGAIATLVGVLKAYVQRKPSLQFEFQMKGGDKLKIKADDLRADDMTKLVQTIKKAVEGMND
jgi:Effector Associated Constant Component 1